MSWKKSIFDVKIFDPNAQVHKNTQKMLRITLIRKEKRKMSNNDLFNWLVNWRKMACLIPLFSR